MTRSTKQGITLIRMGLLSLCIVLSVFTAVAQVPQTINFQGYLTDAAGTPISGNRSMTFKLYTVASGGTAAWTETQPTVAVTNGVYNVRLGSVTPITLNTPAQYYLGVAVGADAEMTPRTALTSVMSALMLRDVAIKGGNTFIGQIAGNATATGNYNTFLGYQAGTANTSGNYNTFLGAAAGDSNTTGYENVFIGDLAGQTNTTGFRNVFIGNEAGYSETGSNKLYIENSSSTSPLIYGDFSTDYVQINGRLGITSQTTTSISYGNRGKLGSATTFNPNSDQNGLWVEGNNGSEGGGIFMNGNTMCLWSPGDADVLRVYDEDDFVTPELRIRAGGSLETYNATAYKPGGGSWTDPSDLRLKDIRAPFTRGLDALDQLQPIAYQYKADNALQLPSDEEYVGLVAQEVQQVIPEAVVQDEGGYLAVNNDPIIWTMLNAIKELRADNQALRQELEALKAGLNQ